MATTINNLLSCIGLDASCIKTVKWGETIPCSSIGIYIVSTSSNPASSNSLLPNAPIDKNILNSWLKKVPSIEIDKVIADIETLHNRLSSFWLADENIIYIGMTESSKGIKGRVSAYYRTELGESKPHAGGHWIKTLSNLNQLYVHYFPTINPQGVEEQLLRAFIEQVSDVTKSKLYDSNLPLPFANLELEKGNRKKHGIMKSKL